MQANSDMKFVFLRPGEYLQELPPKGSPDVDGVAVGYVVEGDVAALTCHIMRGDSFDREIGRQACRGKYAKGKTFEVQILPKAVEESVILGAKYFLLSRGIK